MFVLAFVFAATLAFATNPPVDGAITPTTTEQMATDYPCIACDLCNGRLYCMVAATCAEADYLLDEELLKKGCGGDENDGDDDDDEDGE